MPECRSAAYFIFLLLLFSLINFFFILFPWLPTEWFSFCKDAFQRLPSRALLFHRAFSSLRFSSSCHVFLLVSLLHFFTDFCAFFLKRAGVFFTESTEQCFFHFLSSLLHQFLDFLHFSSSAFH